MLGTLTLTGPKNVIDGLTKLVVDLRPVVVPEYYPSLTNSDGCATLVEIKGNFDRYSAPCGLLYGLNHDIELAVKVPVDSKALKVLGLSEYGSATDVVYGNRGKDEACEVEATENTVLCTVMGELGTSGTTTESPSKVGN